MWEILAAWRLNRLGLKTWRSVVGITLSVTHMSTRDFRLLFLSYTQNKQQFIFAPAESKLLPFGLSVSLSRLIFARHFAVLCSVSECLMGGFSWSAQPAVLIWKSVFDLLRASYISFICFRRFADGPSNLLRGQIQRISCNELNSRLHMAKILSPTSIRLTRAVSSITGASVSATVVDSLSIQRRRRVGYAMVCWLKQLLLKRRSWNSVL